MDKSFYLLLAGLLLTATVLANSIFGIPRIHDYFSPEMNLNIGRLIEFGFYGSMYLIFRCFTKKD